MKKFVILIIKFYQSHISALKKPCCRFFPTCSNYALESVEKFGATKGIFLAILRIFRCNPFCKGGYDPVPKKFGFFKLKKTRRFVAAFMVSVMTFSSVCYTAAVSFNKIYEHNMKFFQSFPFARDLNEDKRTKVFLICQEVYFNAPVWYRYTIEDSHNYHPELYFLWIAENLNSILKVLLEKEAEKEAPLRKEILDYESLIFRQAACYNRPILKIYSGNGFSVHEIESFLEGDPTEYNFPKSV